MAKQDAKEVKYTTFKIHTAKYKTLLTKKFREREIYKPKDDKKVTAFIPGTIKKIYVKEGKDVKNGQKLFILEAMKMDNIITSKVSGKVKEIHVSLDDKVTREQLLLEIV
ncbi:MAG: acetyl-CoA carboxylase biotin carboxyl carrier protein subunit [Bacteroidota bacterium]|nr:acetyl-CoA carboxylase biotin carboxyl carrier protein subunit [Bacteroidota bacterium]